MSRNTSLILALLALASILAVARGAAAADLWPDVLARIQAGYEPVMPDLGEGANKGSGPRGRMVTRDMKTGEITESEGISFEKLMGREFTDGGRGILEDLFDPEAESSNKNFGAWSLVGDPTAGNLKKRVKLWMTFIGANGDTIRSQCSGTLLDPYHVLTAAHCIFAWTTQNTIVNDWADAIQVAAGYSGSNFPFGNAQVAGLTSWTGWTQNNDQDHDVGIITLDRPIGLLTGWYGYGYDEDCDYFTNGTWNMAGYPAESPFDGTLMYQASGNFDDCPVSGWDDQVRWYMPSSGGLSGSGAERGGTMWAVLSTSNRTTRSSVCRITQGKFGDIVNLIAAETHNSTDVLPMTVQAPAAVAQGDAISSFQFIFGNTASIATSGNWNYNMYLSTDSQIGPGDILIDSGSFNQSLPARGATWVSLPTPVISAIQVPAGNYFIGIDITNNDANNSNNDSSGQDAAAITVLCPSQASVPALQTPANAATCVDPTSVWIQWSNIGNYGSYELQIGTSPGTGDVYSTPQTHYVVQNLSLSTTYYWRVRAKRGCGPFSAWSSSRSFTTEINEYTYASLVSPTEGEHCKPANGTMLQWSALPQAQYYEVQISDNWCYEGTIYQPVGTQLYLSNLTPNTTYYWRVRARTTCGTYTNWSSVPGFCWTFKTAPTVVAAPVPNLPLNGSSCANPDAFLLWNHTEDWDTYDVQLGQSCGTGTIYQTSSNGYQLQGLQDGIVYHWRLRVTAECGGQSAWSACSTFTVDAVVPTNPTNLSSNTHQVGVWSTDNTATVWWDYGNDACSGWVEYGIAWDQDPLTIPDTPRPNGMPESSFEESPPLADGIWYFHVRSIDFANNWAIGAEHFGPLYIDATPPTDPVIVADLPINSWTNAAAVNVQWSSVDTGSGIDTYRVAFDQSSSTVPVAFSDETSVIWPITGNGAWFIHVLALDVSGQASNVVHYGPIQIDNSAPVVSASFLEEGSTVTEGEVFQFPFSADFRDGGSPLASAQLKFSADGGVNWEVEHDLSELDFSAGYVEWTVPPVQTSQALLRICMQDAAGNEGSDESNPFLIDAITGIAGGTPGRTQLAGNYPNPFNPRTTIQYSLSKSSRVTLMVFDARGRLVRTLVDAKEEAGEKTVVWDGINDAGRQLPSAVYYYRLRADDLDETRRMVLVK